MRSSQQHICALIPTYNNAGTIVDVVRRVHQYMRDIIVVVDGSTDDSYALLQNIGFPLTIVQHDRNRGKGAALVSGFRKALDLGYDFALTIDGDGQHYPEDIPLILRAHDVHPNALIVGSRQFTDDNMPGKSKFANRFSNFWFALQTTIHLNSNCSCLPRGIMCRLYLCPYASIIRLRRNVSAILCRRATLRASVFLTVSCA